MNRHRLCRVILLVVLARVVVFVLYEKGTISSLPPDGNHDQPSWGVSIHQSRRTGLPLTSSRVFFFLDDPAWHVRLPESNSSSGTSSSSLSRTRTVEALGQELNGTLYELAQDTSKWALQNTSSFQPTCNSVHELDLELNNVQFLMGDGAFRLSALYDSEEQELLSRDRAHIRMLHWQRPWSKCNMIKAMIDAISMERLQSSPHVVSIHQACAHSMLSEYMSGGVLTSKVMLKNSNPYHRSGSDRKVKYFPLERLRYAVQTSQAVSDVHATNMAHMDVQLKNLMLNDQEDVHLNDFNLAWLTVGHVYNPESAIGPSSSNKGFGRNGARKETNQQFDMFALGKVFYTIRTGRPLHQDLQTLWATKKNQSSYLPPRSAVVEEEGIDFSGLQEGKTTHRAQLAFAALEWSMTACLRPDPDRRPAGQEVATSLARVYWEIQANETNLTILDVQRIMQDV